MTNNHASGKALMIPLNTSAEWSSFYNGPPAGTSAGACSVPSVVQTTTATNGSTTQANLSVTFASSLTVGNKVVIGVMQAASSSSSLTVSGCGATFTEIGSSAGGSGITIDLFLGTACSSSTNTITTSGAATQYYGAIAWEVASVSALDVDAGVTSASSAVVTTAAGTSTATNTLAIAFGIVSKGTTLSSGPTNSFTNVGPVSAGSGGTQGTAFGAHKALTSATTFQTSWTSAASGSPANLSHIVTLK